MSSLATALPEEIIRCSRLRDEYLALRGTPGVNVEFALANLTAAIDAATRASASGDVIAMLRCFEDLKGYKS